MKIDFSRRGSGKTSKSIYEAEKLDAYIAVIDWKEAIRVFQQAKKMGLSIKFPITFDELYRRDYHAPGVRKVIIDNADQFIQRLLPDVSVEMLTLTEEPQ